MATIEEVVDKFSGMITPSQAQELIASGNLSSYPHNKDVNNVQTLLQFIETNKDRQTSQFYSVNIQDSVYRVFNPISKRRMMVLGREGATAKLALIGKLSDTVDSDCIERGDTVLINGAILDTKAEELMADRDTAISKVSSVRPQNFFADYSQLKDGMRNIDILGKVVEIGEIRQVSRLGNAGQVPVIDCVITDGKTTARLSLLESSAFLAVQLKVNDPVKIEFCNVRINADRVEIYANSLSRLLSNRTLGPRLI